MVTALNCVTALCVHGITFSKIPPSDSHHFPDDIRTTFISANGVQKVVEELDDQMWDIQEAALGSFKVLCDHGITFLNPSDSDSHHF